MVVTLSDDEVSDHESSSDEDENFIAFIATAIIEESVMIDENPFDGELFKSANLQEVYNKLCKVAMNVDLALQKIASLELDKKKLELELSVAREQTNKTASSKLEHMLSIQKSPLDKTGLSFKDNITVSKTHFTNFVTSSKPPMNEIVKPAKVTPPRKIRVNLKESKSNTPNPSKDKLHDRPTWVYHFCGKSGHNCPNCFKL